MDVFFVFFLGLTVNQDVVKVRGAELVEVVVERVVNKPLEGSRGRPRHNPRNIAILLVLQYY
jgi:hypothetical protein